MKRREFITLLGGTAAWPLPVHAQQPGKLPTIGVLVPGTPSSHGQLFAIVVQRLRELGWIDGYTIAIQFRWAEGRTEQLAEIAAEFVRLKVDVIVTTITSMALGLIGSAKPNVVPHTARTKTISGNICEGKRPMCLVPYSGYSQYQNRRYW